MLQRFNQVAASLQDGPLQSLPPGVHTLAQFLPTLYQGYSDTAEMVVCHFRDYHIKGTTQLLSWSFGIFPSHTLT